MSVITTHRLRASADDEAIIASPPLEHVTALLNRNRDLDQLNLSILDRSLTELRQQARQGTIELAARYLRSHHEPVPAHPRDRLFLAGHQPELFHPGVWVKNFALFGLAQQHECTPLNLVVDNDIAKTTALRIPFSPAQRAMQKRTADHETVPFDRWAPETPYEERTVLDEQLFATLSDRAASVTHDWEFQPLLPAFWAEVRRQSEHTNLLGERFAAARRSLERAWGCHNFELPLSWICRTEPFACFVGHLLHHLPRFHETYNASLNEYRRVYGIRSRSHPVPDLAAEGDWLEVPFWAWAHDKPQRSRLLARLRADSVDLRIGQHIGPSLPLDARRFPRAWIDLESMGIKVRTKALTTTLYTRLFVADLFMHGIGGGKYDELTDEIIRRFFDIEPPAYLVLSGTLLLPFHRLEGGRAEDATLLAHRLRDLQWNPQRHLHDGSAHDPQALQLAAEKKQWIAQQPMTAAERRVRFQVLRTLTSRLRPHVTFEEDQLAHLLQDARWRAAVNSTAWQRDYSFCLFPESKLRPFCTQFLD